MYRRLLLSSISLVAVSGCTSNSDKEDGTDGDTATDSNSDDLGSSDTGSDNSDEYPPTGYIYVYLAITIPDDEPVYDAKEDNLTEVTDIERALETARSEYTDGLEDEIEPEDETHWENKLAEISGNSVADGNAGSKIEGDGVYVEYGGGEVYFAV